MTGNKFGRYEILGELGRGAMGVVYRARDPIIDRVVALKTIDLALTGAALASFEERFFQEARSAGRLNHPNIVTIYDAGKADGVAYMAMEFLEGASLREVLDGHPPLGVTRSVETAGQVARGLAYAHEHGVVHRDIKPANIIILRNRRPKITDFGIARLGAANGVSAERAGSPKYMSPEQIRADATLDGRSDIFSLGAVLYEMLAGQPPFMGDTVTEIMRQVLTLAPPPPSAFNSRVPPELDVIVMRALAKQPEDRYPSARSLYRELRRLEETLDEIGSLSSGTAVEVTAAARASEGPSAADKTLLLGNGSELRVRRSEGRQQRMVIYAAIAAVVAAVGALVPLRLQFSDANATRGETRRVQPVIAAAPEPAPAPAPLPVVPEVQPTPAPETKAVEPEPAPQPPKKVAAPRPARKPVSAPKIQAAPPPPPSLAAAPSAPAAPVAPETAKILFVVAPWGDVYVDGKHWGTTPPLTVVELPPGKHRVEIRNATQMPLLTYLTLQAGDTHRIHHTFVE